MGILLDEFHVQSGNATTRARNALLNFIDTQLRDGDTVAIVKPLDPLHAIAFTQDRSVIRQVITSFEGHAGDYTPRSEFERNFMSRDPKTADPARAQVVSSALIALARRLGDQQGGRKALVFVSEGFRPAQPRAIVNAANRNHVAIHPIDPSPEAHDHDAMLRALAEQTGRLCERQRSGPRAGAYTGDNRSRSSRHRHVHASRARTTGDSIPCKCV